MLNNNNEFINNEFINNGFILGDTLSNILNVMLNIVIGSFPDDNKVPR